MKWKMNYVTQQKSNVQSALERMKMTEQKSMGTAGGRSGSDFSWTWTTEKKRVPIPQLSVSLCIAFYLDYIQYIK